MSNAQTATMPTLKEIAQNAAGQDIKIVQFGRHHLLYEAHAKIANVYEREGYLKVKEAAGFESRHAIVVGKINAQYNFYKWGHADGRGPRD